MLFVSSWDDGHPLDEKLADLLTRYGFKGTFFVPTRNSEGLPVLSSEALRRLDAAHEIGSHTHDHVYLSGLSEKVLRDQIVTGKRALEDTLGHDVSGFCYPGGRYDHRSTLAVAAAGFKYARTVENLRVDGGRNSFCMGTTLQLYPHKSSTLLRNLVKYPQPFYKLDLMRRLLSGQGLPDQLRIAAKFAHDRQDVLHIWGHSWELERFALWDELDDFLCWLREMKATSISLQQLALRSWQN